MLSILCHYVVGVLLRFQFPNQYRVAAKPVRYCDVISIQSRAHPWWLIDSNSMIFYVGKISKNLGNWISFWHKVFLLYVVLLPRSSLSSFSKKDTRVARLILEIFIHIKNTLDMIREAAASSASLVFHCCSCNSASNYVLVKPTMWPDKSSP